MEILCGLRWILLKDPKSRALAEGFKKLEREPAVGRALDATTRPTVSLDRIARPYRSTVSPRPSKKAWKEIGGPGFGVDMTLTEDILSLSREL